MQNVHVEVKTENWNWLKIRVHRRASILAVVTVRIQLIVVSLVTELGRLAAGWTVRVPFVTRAGVSLFATHYSVRK